MQRTPIPRFNSIGPLTNLLRIFPPGIRTSKGFSRSRCDVGAADFRRRVDVLKLKIPCASFGESRTTPSLTCRENSKARSSRAWRRADAMVMTERQLANGGHTPSIVKQLGLRKGHTQCPACAIFSRRHLATLTMKQRLTTELIVIVCQSRRLPSIAHTWRSFTAPVGLQRTGLKSIGVSWRLRQCPPASQS